jgi:cob(I)alamin adenosyltransferase
MDAADAGQIFVGDELQETRFLQQVCAQAVRHSTPLFLACFLADRSPGDRLTGFPSSRGITLRQYGGSCFVNAPPPLADALRAEMGLAEAEETLRGGRYSIVVLCQILDAVGEGLLTPDDLAALVDARPAHVRLILSGRSLPPAVAATPRLTACLPLHAPLAH